MKAIQVKELVDGPSSLVVSDLPDLQPAPDKYIVQVHATAMNFFDNLQIQGKHQSKPPLPFTAGSEFAGVVLAQPTLGQQQQQHCQFKVGHRVFGAAQGAFSTLIQAPEASLRPIPDGWTYAEGSTLFFTAPTAYAALVLRADTREGDHVLIHGAAGGLGLAAIQIAKALRTTVIATVNSRKKRDIAMRYGADFVVDTRSADWVKEVLDLTPAKRGADVVLDPLGLISPSLACTAWNGRLVVIGFAAGSIERIPMNRVLLKNVSIAGLFWGRYQDMEPQMVTAVWDALLGLIREGKLRPTVYTEERFNGLQAVPAAMLCVQNGTAWGKVVVTVTQHAGSKL